MQTLGPSGRRTAGTQTPTCHSCLRRRAWAGQAGATASATSARVLEELPRFSAPLRSKPPPRRLHAWPKTGCMRRLACSRHTRYATVTDPRRLHARPTCIRVDAEQAHHRSQAEACGPVAVVLGGGLGGEGVVQAQLASILHERLPKGLHARTASRTTQRPPLSGATRTPGGANAPHVGGF